MSWLLDSLFSGRPIDDEHLVLAHSHALCRRVFVQPWKLPFPSHVNLQWVLVSEDFGKPDDPARVHVLVEELAALLAGQSEGIFVEVVF